MVEAIVFIIPQIFLQCAGNMLKRETRKTIDRKLSMGN